MEGAEEFASLVNHEECALAVALNERLLHRLGRGLAAEARERRDAAWVGGNHVGELLPHLALSRARVGNQEAVEVEWTPTLLECQVAALATECREGHPGVEVRQGEVRLLVDSFGDFDVEVDEVRDSVDHLALSRREEHPTEALLLRLAALFARLRPDDVKLLLGEFLGRFVDHLVVDAARTAELGSRSAPIGKVVGLGCGREAVRLLLGQARASALTDEEVEFGSLLGLPVEPVDLWVLLWVEDVVGVEKRGDIARRLRRVPVCLLSSTFPAVARLRGGVRLRRVLVVELLGLLLRHRVVGRLDDSPEPARGAEHHIVVAGASDPRARQLVEHLGDLAEHALLAETPLGRLARYVEVDLLVTLWPVVAQREHVRDSGG